MNELSKEHLSELLNSDKDYMGEEQLSYFRSVLAGWKAEILKENELAVMRLQKETSSMADLSDRATQEESFSLTLKSRDRERKLISKIEAALERINNQNFGYCDLCDAEIGVLRLQARPTAELCIDCKEIEEKKEKAALS